MIEQGILELINKDIDGVCTPAESSRLQDILRTNPEANKLHEDLRLLAVTLQKMPAAEPPRSLKPAILRALESKSAPRHRPSTAAGWLTTVLGRRSRSLNNWRGAMENAAGKTPKSPRPILVIAGSLVAIAVVVYFSFFYPPVPASDTEGTIGAVKKYHTEQISEQDVVLDAMTSTNEAVVAKAMSQTNAKIAENAFALSKAAEEALADAKMAKFRSYCEGVQNMAREAEKMAKRTEGVASEARKLEKMATELASQAEALKKTGEKMKEAASLSEGVAVLSKGFQQAQELGIRGEFIAVSAEARRMLDRMESSLAEGSREEASQILAAAAQEFGRRGEALQVLGRAGEAKEVLAVAQQLSSQAEAVKAGGNMQQALESSQVLVGKIETLALPEAARRNADQ